MSAIVKYYKIKLMSQCLFKPKCSVNKDQLSNNTSSHETIKTIRCIHDITKTGFSGTETKKVNQDNFFIYKNFNSNPNSIKYNKSLKPVLLLF